MRYFPLSQLNNLRGTCHGGFQNIQTEHIADAIKIRIVDTIRKDENRADERDGEG